jgi:hypothetical protein
MKEKLMKSIGKILRGKDVNTRIKEADLNGWMTVGLDLLKQ